MSLPAKNLAMILIMLSSLTTSCFAESGSLHKYRLGIGDQINVTVFGETELSDELLIDGAGNVEMPLVGPVRVIRKTLAEARTLITQRLANGFLKEPVVTVNIGKLRPIFVLGDVRTPGQHPFEFGLTVLNAVAIAGGFGSERFRMGRGQVMADLIAAEERLRVLSPGYATQLVRVARIEAEQNDREYFDVPNLPKIMSHLDINELAERELQRLKSSRRAHERLLKLLRDQKPTIRREIEARRDEILAQKELIEIFETQLKRLSSIKLVSRILELRTQLAQARGLLSRLRGEIAALEEKLVSVDIRTEEANTKRMERITSELAETRQKLSEAEAALPSVIESVELRRRQAGQIFESDDWQRNYEISLKRGRTGELRKVSAADPASVEPGDTIIVRMIRPADGGRRSMAIDKFSSPGKSREDPPQPARKAPRPEA